MSSYCAMCQVVQESCVERLWVPQSVEPAEALSLARSLSTCLPLQLLCLQLCSAVLEATGSCGHSQGTCSFTFRSPVLQRVEETFLTKCSGPSGGGPRLRTVTIGMVTWSLKPSVMLCWLVSIVFLVMLPPSVTVHALDCSLQAPLPSEPVGAAPPSVWTPRQNSGCEASCMVVW